MRAEQLTRPKAPFKRVAIGLFVSLIVFPLICVNITTAGWVSEEIAELTHGTVGVLVWLWAIDALHWPEWLSF